MPSPETELGMILSESFPPEIPPLFSEALFNPPPRKSRSGRSVTFNHKIKDQVYQQQKERCALCGTYCRGHEMREPEMQIHHAVPLALGGDNSRTNAIGLCADNCHPMADRLYEERGITVFQYLKSQGKSYSPMRGHKR